MRKFHFSAITNIDQKYSLFLHRGPGPIFSPCVLTQNWIALPSIPLFTNTPLNICYNSSNVHTWYSVCGLVCLRMKEQISSPIATEYIDLYLSNQLSWPLQATEDMGEGGLLCSSHPVYCLPQSPTKLVGTSLLNISGAWGLPIHFK